MNYWNNLFKTFNHSQQLIGNLERMTREQSELEESRWSTVDDYSPAQRAYDDKHYKPKKQEEKPF
jgi:hypothetical protein